MHPVTYESISVPPKNFRAMTFQYGGIHLHGPHIIGVALGFKGEKPYFHLYVDKGSGRWIGCMLPDFINGLPAYYEETDDVVTYAHP